MKKHFAPLLPYLLALAAVYYLFPLTIRFLGPFVLMLAATPLLCLLCGFFCGRRLGYRPLLSAVALPLFLPALPLFYNLSTWVYAPVFAAFVLLGTLLGSLCRGR